jgi:cytochrome c biogenesis protein CcmG/thiol:disulfide interchange protein DsbE
MAGKTRFLLPVGVFAVIVVFLGIGLTLDPRKVPSPLVDKPAPGFTLPRLDDPAVTMSPAELQGKVWLLNVWASWCVSCRAEHEVLKQLAARDLVPIIGLNYKDQSDAARQWLRQLGDPYAASVVDAEGRTGIDWGVYGVPETFVIDRRGVIRYKHIGPVSGADLDEKIIPIIRRLVEEKA